MSNLERHGLILMTALPPTIGHAYLIDWALQYQKARNGGPIHVLVSTRSKEPIPGYKRTRALRAHYANEPMVIVHEHEDDTCPQNPSESASVEEFWNYWRRTIDAFVPIPLIDTVFASEAYGADVARTVGAEFIPVDIQRDILWVKATAVRSRPDKFFHHLLPEIQDHFRRTITFFGGESCGKTTQARNFANTMGGYFVHEWARPYLETVGEEITQHKMNVIEAGQYATQLTVRSLRDKPFVFQDTDLLTTIGYNLLFGMTPSESLINKFEATRSDLYIVMNGGIPFERDPLRYGGDQRQGNDAFWIDLLEKFNCNYHYVGTTERDVQEMEITGVLMRDFHSHAGTESFIRT